jgi:hypothetical protein
MSAGRVLRFTHRFRSGALCEIEIDVEAVRDNSFTPHFRWRGTTHKAHEFICWARDVFGIVANRAGVPVLWCFVHRGNGATRDLDLPAGREAAKNRKGGGTVM